MKYRIYSYVAGFVLSGFAVSVQALSYQTPPVADELAMPMTESEVGGIGCIVGSLVVGGSMLYLIGGMRPIVASIAPPLTPMQVLEGSAAAAFVFSSACYIGVALAPLTMATYTAISDSLVMQMPIRPLYAPGELNNIASGTFIPDHSSTVPAASPEVMQPAASAGVR